MRLTIAAPIAVLALSLVLTRAPGLDARAPDAVGHVVAALPGYDSAAALRRIGPLSPAEADEAERGAISPDGRWFTYEVLRGGEWSIWRIDVATGRATPLTMSVGGTALGWSPEGSRLAFVRAGAGWPYAASGGEIVISDLERGVDRVLYAEPADSGLVFGPTWWGDSAILAISQAPASLATRFRSIRVRDGAVRVLTPTRHLDEAPAVSPDGRRVAFFSGLCCGGGGRALWVMALDGSGAQRCLAGPLRNEGARPAWSADGRTIYFAAAHSSDAVSHAYAVDVDGADGRGAHRIEQLDGRIASVSATRRGELALVAVPARRRTGELWFLSRPATVTTNTDSIPACPEASVRIPEFVRHEELPNVLDIGVIARVPRARFALFGVSYGRQMDWGLYEGRVGVQYGDRIGWLSTGGLTSTPTRVDSVARRHTLFRLTAADRELLSESFDSALARHTPESMRPWREYVLQHAFAPPALLRRYLREDPQLAGRIASSPALLHPDMPQDVLLSLAEADPQIARAALDAGRLDDARALLRLARASRPERPIISDDELYRRLYASGAALAADPRTPEDVLAALALATWYSYDDPSLYRTLLRNPSARRSRRVLLLLAAKPLDGGTPESEQARALLAPGGLPLERTWLELLTTLGPTQRETVGRRLIQGSTSVQQSAPVLLLIAADSTLSQSLRDYAAQTLAWNRAASEADLLALTRTLAGRPSDIAARHLLDNGTVRQSPALLRAIMELRSLRDTTIRAAAKQLLEEQSR